MVHDALRRESEAWVVLMLSGAATQGDADALKRWRARSPAHETAFRDAVRLQKLVKEAAAELRAEAETDVGAAGANLRLVISRQEPRRLNRRALMTGAIAASAAGIAVFGGGQALHLWPMTGAADFATAKGEQRTIALGQGVSAELNTLTRMARRPELGANGVELLEGEVMLTAALAADVDPLVVLAGNGRAVARNAQFSLRCVGAEVSVTCVEGSVAVDANGVRRAVPPGHKLDYDASGFGALVAIDPAAVTAWRRGVLVFSNEPLRNVVAEINRYREGRIIVSGDRLASREVTGTFYVAQIDEIFEQVRSAFGARVTRLPGDVVVLT